jgi:hypothetical protein
VHVSEGSITDYQVNMLVTFVNDDQRRSSGLRPC